ncbi:MAG: tetratricopeptide repeat protein [Elusimicrobiales bacterium]|nr:tetratricopeptide repeat protein [Elusimicrobiales bacterium]
MPENTWIASGQPDTAPAKTDLALAWIKAHRETFIGSVVILLAAALFAVYFFIHYRGLRETAWKNLFVAQQIGYQGDIPKAQEQLAAIERSYGSTSAAPYATLTKGDILFAQGKFKEAGEEYAKVTTARDVGPFAVYNLGKCKEAAGDLPGAQAQYADFLSRNPEHFMAPEAHASLARTQELAGAKDLAKTTYEKIALLYPDTSWAGMAKARLGQAPAPAKK